MFGIHVCVFEASIMSKSLFKFLVKCFIENPPLLIAWMESVTSCALIQYEYVILPV